MNLYNLPVWDDMRTPVSAVRLPGVQAPGFGTFGLGNIGTLQFDNAIEESVHFITQMTHKWDAGSTDLKPHIHWTSTASSTEVVSFGLEYSYAEIGSTFTAPTTIYTTDSPGGDLVHEISSFPDIDMSGTSTSSISLTFACRLFRNTSGTDTYGADISLLEFDFHYEERRNGSTSYDG